MCPRQVLRGASTKDQSVVSTDPAVTVSVFQAYPEGLFEATLAEGVSFKVKAAATDASGFHSDGELLELEFR